MSWLSKSKKPEYSPNEVFPTIDRDWYAKDLDLVAKGARNGRNNLPESGRTARDTTENTIISEIEKIRREGLYRFGEQEQVYKERIGRIDGIGASIGQAAFTAETDFRREVVASRERLEDMRKDFNEVRDERNRFQESNRLDRAEHPYKGGWQWWLITVVLVAIESGMNGVFFADAHVKGLQGGFAIALVISVVNIGTATISGHLFRNVNHIHFRRKMIGYLSFIVGIFVAISGNYLVGTFRDAAVKVPLERAPGVVFERLDSGQFMMESLDAWLLVALGILIAAIAGWKAYTMTDPYPGYGRVGRKFVQAREELRDLHEDTLNALTDTRDKATMELDRHRDDAQSNIDNAVTAYEGLVALKTRRTSFLRDCDVAADHLLTVYRDANRQTRETPAPACFSEAYRFPPEPEPEPPNRPDADAMKQFRETVSDAIRRIHDECGKAISSFDSGDKATGGTS